MAKITYKYNDTTQLTPHFNVKEFRCKCNHAHDIIIDNQLPALLEKLMEKIGAEHGNIYSGYRCPSHNAIVGSKGKGTNYSHSGYAVDIYFTDKDGKRIPSSTVCLALEDMGHKYGIGYRCGGGKDSSGQTHIDVKPRKWYGDESKSMTASCCSSFYDYFGKKKETPQKYTGTIPKLRLGIYGWKKGDKNKNVGYIQAFLNWYMNANLAVDNSFGPATQEAVKKFQTKERLSVDGKFGPACIKRMKQVEK